MILYFFLFCLFLLSVYNPEEAPGTGLVKNGVCRPHLIYLHIYIVNHFSSWTILYKCLRHLRNYYSNSCNKFYIRKVWPVIQQESCLLNYSLLYCNAPLGNIFWYIYPGLLTDHQKGFRSFKIYLLGYYCAPQWERAILS